MDNNNCCYFCSMTPLSILWRAFLFIFVLRPPSAASVPFCSKSGSYLPKRVVFVFVYNLCALGAKRIKMRKISLCSDSRLPDKNGNNKNKVIFNQNS